MNYLEKNKEFWERGYQAIQVDHPIFRFYGRILKPDFKMDGNGERVLDFGCGQGSAVNFFHLQGFNAVGVDISEYDISIGRIRYPHLNSKLLICHPEPSQNDYYGFKEDISVVTAIQSLYYFSDSHFNMCLDKIYNSMKKGGIFFATMMGERCSEFFENSTPVENGLRVVNFRNDRLDVKGYYMFFIKDEVDLRNRFKMFKPLHIGYYSAKLRTDEGDGFHYTFCGIKE